MHVIGPELGVTQPGHDDRLRRLAHLDARRLRRARLRDRHLRGRARARDADAAAAQAAARCGSRFVGELPPGADARRTTILAAIGKIGVDGGVGQVIEYAGAAIRGALDGGPHDDLQHVDRGRRARGHDRARRDDVRLPRRAARARRAAPTGTRPSTRWRSLPTDEGATFDREVEIDVSRRSARRSRGARTRAWSCSLDGSRARSGRPAPTRTTAPPPSARSTTWRSSRARRSRRSASTASSSAPARTRGSRTCAPPPPSRRAATSTPTCARRSCRALRW